MNIDSTVDVITEDLLYILPLLHRKLLKIEFEQIDVGLSRLHFIILRILSHHGPLAISEIGKRLFIPKPQMTALVDKLIQHGMVDRLPDTEDRRVINIDLTEKGKETLNECDKLIRSSIRQKLSSLSPSALQELMQTTSRLREIGAKLE